MMGPENSAFYSSSVSDTLQTSFLFLLEVNASLSHLQNIPEEPLQEGPKRKAMRFTPRTTITISEALRITQQQLQDAQACGSASAKDFATIGTLQLLTEEFFEQDPPILSTESKDVMCLKTELHDPSGKMPVKLWDKPCYELFEMTADKNEGLLGGRL